MKFEMKDGIKSVPKPRLHPGFGTKNAGAGGTAKHTSCDPSTTRCKALGPRQHRYLSVKSVAQRFDVSVNTIWRWARNGEFPAPVKFSGTTRWKEMDLIDYEERTSVFTSSIPKGMRK